MNTASQNQTRRTLSSDDDIRQAVRLEQVRVLYSAIPFNIMATLLNAGLLAYIEWRFIEHNTVFIWLSAVVVIAVIRLGLGIGYKRSVSPSSSFWGTSFIITALMTSVIWGGAVFLLFPEDNIINQVLLAVVIMGLAAGSITSLSYLRIIGIGYVTLLLLPLLFRLGALEHEYALVMTALCLLFYIAMLISVLRFYKQTSQNIELSYKSANDAIAVRSAKEQAERANAAKSVFLSSMSHELRTPMNAIMGFAQIMQIDSKNPLTETQAHHVGEIMSASEHLLSMIDDILDLSQIESGEIITTLTKTNIGQVVNESVSFVNHMVQKKQINISIQENLAKYFVLVDSTRLKQVLVNLLHNAIEYNKESGKVSITAEQDAGMLTLSIRDTGVGIDATELDKLFMPFHRLDAINNVSGAGIGLALSKHLVELMDGQIGVESEPGKGSRFWISLPVA